MARLRALHSLFVMTAACTRPSPTPANDTPPLRATSTASAPATALAATGIDAAPTLAALPELPVVPKLHFRRWTESADAGEGIPGYTVLTESSGVPAISVDGKRVVVRFESDGTICGRAEYLLVDVPPRPKRRTGRSRSRAAASPMDSLWPRARRSSTIPFGAPGKRRSLPPRATTGGFR